MLYLMVVEIIEISEYFSYTLSKKKKVKLQMFLQETEISRTTKIFVTDSVR